MDRLSHNALVVVRVLISVVFILNDVGIIDQTIPAKELMERGDTRQHGSMDDAGWPDVGICCRVCTRVGHRSALGSIGTARLSRSRHLCVTFVLASRHESDLRTKKLRTLVALTNYRYSGIY